MDILISKIHIFLKHVLDYPHSKFHFISTNIWLFVRKSLRRSVPREVMAAAVIGSCCCGSTAWSQWQRVAPTCMLCCLLRGSSY